MTYLSKVWLKYLDGKATIAEVVAEYEKNGFDACQDIPGQASTGHRRPRRPRSPNSLFTSWDSCFVSQKDVGVLRSPVPGNYHWKELYDHLGPDTKVILTVRDDADRWWNSYVNFFTQETEFSFQINFLCSISYASKITFFENWNSVVGAAGISIMVTFSMWWWHGVLLVPKRTDFIGWIGKFCQNFLILLFLCEVGL